MVTRLGHDSHPFIVLTAFRLCAGLCIELIDVSPENEERRNQIRLLDVCWPLIRALEDYHDVDRLFLIRL